MAKGSTYGIRILGATSFSKVGGTKPCGENAPTSASLTAPHGMTLEMFARNNPQRTDEFYNEFDLIDPSSADAGLILLSYGERVSTCEGIDYAPFVKRAKKFAESYYEFLECESRPPKEPFQILRREWYCVTNPNLAVVHVYFRV